MAGYFIFLACAAAMLAIGLISGKKVNRSSVGSLIFVGGHVSSPTLTFSVFAAWMWTTSIIGAAETYALYGVLGPVAYVSGACIAFAGLIAFIAFLRRTVPRSPIWLDFIRQRYGLRSKQFYYIFAVIVPAYVLIEQGVGIGFILEEFYGSAFRLLSFLSVMLALVIVFSGGMKSTLAVEGITAGMILLVFFTGMAMVLSGGLSGEDITSMIHRLPSGGGLGQVLMPAIKYFVTAIVIASGQIVFDPAWYFKANLVGNTRKMAGSFALGGILLWGGTSLIAAIYLGWTVSAGGNVMDSFAGPAKVVFSVAMIFIGVSTIVHYLMGTFGIFTIDLHRMLGNAVIAGDRQQGRRDGSQTEQTDEGSADRRQIVFGRVMLVAFGIFCACMTIALQNVSLLSIDIFCAIFFAAPCVPLVIGCFSRRNFGRLPVIGSIAGIVCGLVFWGISPGSMEQAQFMGLAASMIVPLAIMLPGMIGRLPYDR